MKKRVLVSERQMNLLNRKKRILVSETQLNRIVKHINNKEVLEEGMGTNIVLALVSAISSLNLNAQDINVVTNNDVQKKAAVELSQGDANKEGQILQTIEDNEAYFVDEYKKKLGSVNTNMTVHGDSEVDVARVLAKLKSGYAIKSMHKDTIVHEIPAEVFELKVDTVITPEGANMFNSGGFDLGDSFKGEIIKQIKSHGSDNKLIVGLTIQSSTDKEKVTESLAQTLTELGLTANNEGLSEARNNSVKEFLVSNLDIDSELIEQDILFNQGDEIKDSNARFVKTYIFYIEVPQIPSDAGEEITINTVFELAKPISKSKIKTGGTKSNCYVGKCANPFN